MCKRTYLQSCMAAIGLMLLVSLSAFASTDPLTAPAMQSAKAAHGLLLGVTTAGNRLVAVGEHGIIVYSDNEGKQWIQASVPVSVTLTAVYFSDAKNGWAVGHDGVVLNSTDAGVSWTKRFDGNQANALMLAEAQSQLASNKNSTTENTLADIEAGAKFGPSRPLLGVWFKSPNEGWVAGSYGQLFYTADAGLHWESLASRMHNPDGLHFNSISGTADGTLLIAGEAGKVYRSTDGLTNWQCLDSGYQGQLYGVLELHQSLLAFGFGGHVLQYGKQHWQALPTLTNKNIIAGTVLADGRVVLVSQDGALLTPDRLLVPGSGLALAGMVLMGDGRHIAVAGQGGVHVLGVNQ
jgi:photosystem II stability/assembly factor-like uncharacterized protein